MCFNFLKKQPTPEKHSMNPIPKQYTPNIKPIIKKTRPYHESHIFENTMKHDILYNNRDYYNNGGNGGNGGDNSGCENGDSVGDNSCENGVGGGYGGGGSR